MNHDAGSADPANRLLALLGGKWITAAVSAAASLGIADVLADGPLPLDALARRVHCDPASLERLMRVLVGEGVFALDERGHYANDEVGALLRRGEMGELASYVGEPFGWDPWSGLAQAVRTGESAFAKHHGLGLFEFLDHHPEPAALYHAAIDAFSRREDRAIVEAFDFSAARCVADLGGGRGHLLVQLLRRWKHLSGVLLERPAAVEAARTTFEAAGLAERCEARVGDFFSEVPDDADVCVLKHVVHSWDDETAARLLRRCGDAVGPEGRVLLVEGLLLPGGRRDLTNLLDLEMLVLFGSGRERSKPEMRRLIASSGLQLLETVRLDGGSRLLVTRPRPTTARPYA